MRCEQARNDPGRSDAVTSPAFEGTSRWLAILSIPAAVVLLGVSVALAAGGSTPSSEESIEARRERLAKLSAEDREELRAKRERFERMLPDEQNKVRELHEQISSAPDGEKLRGVMDRYNEWLKTLSPGQRADLLAMSADARIEEIRKIRKMQEDNRLRRLGFPRITADDSRAIYNWLGELVERNREQLVSQMSPKAKEEFEKIDDPAVRRRILVGRLLFWQPRSSSNSLTPTKDDIDRLAGNLSPDARKVLDQLPETSRKLYQIREWVGFVAGRFNPEVDQKELEKFYQEVSQTQRDMLDRLPRDQMYQELKRLYVASKFKRHDNDGGKKEWPGFHPNPGSGRFFPRGSGNGPGERKWEGRGDRPEGSDGRPGGRGDGSDGRPGGRNENRGPGPRPEGGPTGPPPGERPEEGPKGRAETLPAEEGARFNF